MLPNVGSRQSVIYLSYHFLTLHTLWCHNFIVISREMMLKFKFSIFGILSEMKTKLLFQIKHEMSNKRP